MSHRIGQGVDVHAFSDDPDRVLVLGGVTVEDALGLEGHSDADVLSHACADAVLGAAGLGDLGDHFPDTDPQWANADSLELLARVVWLAGQRGYAVVNCDATVLLERPRLRPYVQQMRERLAQVLSVEVSCVSVKAKTGEGLDAVGERRAVTAHAVVLLQKI